MLLLLYLYAFLWQSGWRKRCAWELLCFVNCFGMLNFFLLCRRLGASSPVLATSLTLEALQRSSMRTFTGKLQ